MKTARSRRVFLSFVTAFALLLPISPHPGGWPHAGLAMGQGSRLPGMPVPSTDTANARDRGPVKFRFTKWVTTFPLMEGFTEGHVTGDFVGEVFERRVTVNPNLNRIVQLEAVYEVHAGGRSFTALIRGGTNAVTGAAILEGVVLAGWRTGAHVHVEFETIPGTTGCVGAPQGVTCFEGIIRVGRAPKD